ncbi:hypothetical protein CBOM_05957 [Ceraceosorus bombacis]|uniref:Uncharacterized protein n=1 Tax=Ceraceosorus bombacis TaxID=401625 RepID=A0A0P1BIW7_9BASI|nr:hypothetical protein CBOM_05957 [Ceraceosorus bombacis]
MELGNSKPHARPMPPGARRRGAERTIASATGSPLPNSPALPSVSETGTGDDYVAAKQLSSSKSRQQVGQEISIEDMEAALGGVSREELVLALKRSKEYMDALDAKCEAQQLTIEEQHASIDVLSSSVSLAEAESSSLQGAVNAREERIDELLAGQDRTEEELDQLHAMVARLSKQVQEAEKLRNDAERRYTEQVTTSDKEREFFADTENLLSQQKANTASANERLMSANAELLRENEVLQARIVQSKSNTLAPADLESEASPPSKPNPEVTLAASKRALADEKATSSSLRQERDALQKSYNGLVDTLKTVQQELGDIREAYSALRKESLGYLDMLEEKTLSGALITESRVLNRAYGTMSISDGSIDSEDESEDTQGDTSVATTQISDNTNGDVEDVPPPRKPRRSVSKRSSALPDSPGAQRSIHAPTTLENELAEVDEAADQRESKRRELKERRDREGAGESMPTAVPDLQREVKELRDANKALTLYVSRIIDRIVTRAQGFEDVLAIDDSSQARGTSSRLRGQRSRPLLAVSPPRSAGASSSPSQAQKAQAAADKAAEEAKKARRASGGLLGFGRLASDPDVSPIKQTVGVSSSRPTPPAKNRRSASIDWKSWLPGAGTAPDPREAQLRSLTLSPAMTSTSRVVSSETEEGREKLRAHFEMQGLSPMEIRAALGDGSASVPSSTPLAEKRASVGTFLSRVMPFAQPGPPPPATP